MKFVVVFVAVLSVALADWAPVTKENFFKIREECMNESNVSTADRDLIKTNKLPDNREVYCYVRCIGQKTGTWDDRTGYNVDRVFAMFEAHDLVVSKENLKSCFNPLMDADTCTWAAVNMKCLWDNKYITRKNKA